MSKYWQIVNLVVVGAFIIMAIISFPGKGDADSILGSAASRMASSNLLTSPNPFDELFDGGAKSIPYLLDLFSSREPYRGSCGMAFLRSDSIEVGEIEDIVGPDSVLDVPDSLEAIPEVREVALYLLIAILGSNKYFAESCRLLGPDGNSEALEGAIEEVRIKYKQAVTEERALCLDDVLGALSRRGLEFPKRL